MNISKNMEEVSSELAHMLEQWAMGVDIDVPSFKQSFVGSPLDETQFSANQLIKCFVDRVENVWNWKRREDVINKFKSDSKAKDWRRKGNTYLTEKLYDEAVGCFSLAIRFACVERTDSTEGNELVLAYSQRSAVNFICERWRQTIDDINMCERYGFLGPELQERRAKSEKKLSEEKGQNRDVEMMAIDDDLAEALANCALGAEEKHEIESINPMMPAASVKLSISHDIEKGRGLQANQPIKFGEVLVRDLPYGHSLFLDCYDDYCQVCCKPFEAFSVPCPVCTLVQYCSQDCLEADETHFRYSCHPEIPHIYDPLIQLMLRVMVSAFLPGKRSNQTSDQVYESNYDSFSKLTYPATLSSDFVLPAIYLGIVVSKIVSSIPGVQSVPSLVEMIRTIFLHFHRLLVNKAFLVTSNDFVKFTNSAIPDEASEKIGLAVYPTLSLINHSCQPNVFLFFSGSKAIVRASQNIGPGQELFLCYGPSYVSDTLLDRRKKLREWYYFDCKCSACAQSLESRQICYKCTACSGPLIVNEDDSNRCLSCRKVNLPIPGVKQLITEALNELENGRLTFEMGDDCKAVSTLSNCYNTMNDHLYRSNRRLLQARTYLYECLSSMGHYEKAAKLCAVNVNVTKEVSGWESVDYVIIMITYLGLMFKHLTDLVDESKTQAVGQAQMILGFANEQIERLTRLSKLADPNADPVKIFLQEMRSLDDIKTETQRILDHLSLSM